MSVRQRVFVAGHKGMVGSAIVRRLVSYGEADIVMRERSELDLLDTARVDAFFRSERIDAVYLAAARVGGIQANAVRPAEFIFENLRIETNVIDAAHRAGVERLLFLGSSCIYPRHADQPMREEALLTGLLEPTNEPYAIAKIAGLKLCESYNRQYGRDYRAVMPTNLYGTNDNFDQEVGHVIPALIRRFHEACADKRSEVVIWGSGTPRREFLHIDDLAAACLHVMALDRDTFEAETDAMRYFVNVGTGEEVTIRQLAGIIADIAGFRGAVRFDTSRPNGTPRKLLDTSRLSRLGWSASIGLEPGLTDTYRWFQDHVSAAQGIRL